MGARRRTRARTRGTAAIVIVVPILAVILAYVLIPPLFYSHVAVYDNLPPGPTGLSTIQFSIANNSPVTLPQASPTYILGVRVESNASAITCTISTFKGDLPCHSTTLVLGTISPGGSASATVRIQTNGNFTIRIYVYMTYLWTQTVASKPISCTTNWNPTLYYQGSPMFTCSEVS